MSELAMYTHQDISIALSAKNVNCSSQSFLVFPAVAYAVFVVTLCNSSFVVSVPFEYRIMLPELNFATIQQSPIGKKQSVWNAEPRLGEDSETPKATDRKIVSAQGRYRR